MTLIRWRNSQNFNIRPYILAHLSKSELFCFIFVIFACAQMRQPLLLFIKLKLLGFVKHLDVKTALNGSVDKSDLRA